MPRPTEQQIVSAHEKWVGSDDPAKTMETLRVIMRLTDRKFLKVFPMFVDAVLDAIFNKKLKGAGDLLFYLMRRAMELPVNAVGRNLGVHITIEDVAQATRKKERAIKKNLRTLLDLGFLVQPILPPIGWPVHRLAPCGLFSLCLCGRGACDARR